MAPRPSALVLFSLRAPLTHATTHLPAPPRRSYKCFKCEKLYFGGLKRCGGGGGREPEPNELICASCVPGAGEVVCAKHGDEL